MRIITSSLLLFFATIAATNTVAAERYTAIGATTKTAPASCPGHCVCNGDGKIILCW